MGRHQRHHDKRLPAGCKTSDVALNGARPLGLRGGPVHAICHRRRRLRRYQSLDAWIVGATRPTPAGPWVAASSSLSSATGRAKAEYLYVDLGNFNCGLSCGSLRPTRVVHHQHRARRRQLPVLIVFAIAQRSTKAPGPCASGLFHCRIIGLVAANAGTRAAKLSSQATRRGCSPRQLPRKRKSR